MNLPNALTILRIFFVPLLVAALVQENVGFQIGAVKVTNEWFIAGFIFLVAAATDLLDGYLARRWKQVTTTGTLLDPIADKLLVSAALISLVQIRALPGWMAVLIIGREFAVSGLRSIAAAEGYTIKASDLGKTKMFCQVVAISVMLKLAVRHPALHTAGLVLMWGVVFFAMASAISYFGKFWHKVDESVKNRRRLRVAGAGAQTAARCGDVRNDRWRRAAQRAVWRGTILETAGSQLNGTRLAFGADCAKTVFHSSEMVTPPALLQGATRHPSRLPRGGFAPAAIVPVKANLPSVRARTQTASSAVISTCTVASGLGAVSTGLVSTGLVSSGFGSAGFGSAVSTGAGVASATGDGGGAVGTGFAGAGAGALSTAAAAVVWAAI